MPSSSSCRIEPVLDCIGEQWTLAIIHELASGPRRTLELNGAFSGMSSKTLAVRLKKLERRGVVARKSYPQSPPRVEYSLTEKGRELLIVLRAITEVALQWDDDMPASDKSPCRACSASDEMRAEPLLAETEDSETTRPHARPRKRADVTLL
jgi:DNA-binding HxlR family transcriptional regulator